METLCADDVDTSVSLAVAALRPGTGPDWRVPAGSLEWSCHWTAVHVADDLVSYAGQLTGRAADGHVPFLFTVEDGVSPGDLLSVVTATGGLLSAAVRCTPAAVRAWHPYGSTGPEGFAAMGITEVLVHTHDIAQGLGLPWQPPQQLCDRVLARLFPHVDRGGGDPWATLLWATGRGGLPDREPLTAWRWYGDPHDPAVAGAAPAS